MNRFSLIMVMVAILALQALALYGLGRSVICPCGLKVWDSVLHGPENSQHLLDWYSISHLTYGFLFYFICRLLQKKIPIPWRALFLLAIAISAGWEIFENTYYAIERYQQNTISTQYHGDSIINSLMDTASMALGFFLASHLPAVMVVAIALGLEILMVTTIRDSLLLNTIMFAHPFKAVLHWQLR